MITASPGGPATLPILAREHDNTLACIRCGLCLSVCPTYQETFLEAESPRGRIAMARALIEGHLPLTPDLLRHQDSCLLCDACTAICPAGFKMEPLGVALRGAVEPLRQRPLWQRALRRLVFDFLFADLRAFRAAARLGQLYQQSGLQWLAHRLGAVERLGLARLEAFLPPLRGRFLVPRGQRWRPLGRPVRARAALLAGCVMSTAFAETARATARALAASGYEVVVPAGQQCCGALHAHSGDLAGATRLARANIAAFERAGAEVVVSNAAGCGAMLKHYAHLLRDDPAWRERAVAFSARCRDVSQALTAVDLPGPLGGVDATVTYQEPCHLAHAQRVSAEPRRLLDAIPGLRRVEQREPALCCGSAGVYNVTNPEMADRLLRRKVGNILATGARLVATGNPGCLLQIRAGLRAAGRGDVQVVHTVDLIDRALRAGGARVVELPPEDPASSAAPAAGGANAGGGR